MCSSSCPLSLLLLGTWMLTNTLSKLTAGSGLGVTVVVVVVVVMVVVRSLVVDSVMVALVEIIGVEVKPAFRSKGVVVDVGMVVRGVELLPSVLLPVVVETVVLVVIVVASGVFEFEIVVVLVVVSEVEGRVAGVVAVVGTVGGLLVLTGGWGRLCPGPRFGAGMMLTGSPLVTATHPFPGTTLTAGGWLPKGSREGCPL